MRLDGTPTRSQLIKHYAHRAERRTAAIKAAGLLVAEHDRQVAEARRRFKARALTIREDAALQAEGRVEATLGQLDTTVEEYAATVDELWKRPRLVPEPPAKFDS
jgi:hypothetical protein